MPQVVVTFELSRGVESLRGEVGAYLRSLGVAEARPRPEERLPSVLVHGGFPVAAQALEISRQLRKGVEAIVGQAGLKRFTVTVAKADPTGGRASAPDSRRFARA